VNYYVIGDSSTVMGFQLAGVSGEPVEDPSHAEDALRAAAEDPNIGILMVTERIAEENRSVIQDIHARETGPVVVEIPGPEGTLPGRRNLIDLIQEALGIRL